LSKRPSSISRRELIRKLKTLGFSGPFSGGRHQFMIKGPLKLRIPNPHSGKDIHISLLQEILRQAGISQETWNKI
jgi:predicted RNA binding protein YcfA (HicA-like mRNA interferase family)